MSQHATVPALDVPGPGQTSVRNVSRDTRGMRRAPVRVSAASKKAKSSQISIMLVHRQEPDELKPIIQLSNGS